MKLFSSEFQAPVSSFEFHQLQKASLRIPGVLGIPVAQLAQGLLSLVLRIPECKTDCVEIMQESHCIA